MISLRLLLIVLVVLLSTLVSPLVTAAPGADSKAVLADLGWLAGCWHNGDDNKSSEECWLAPKGGVMLGMNRTVRGERSSFEFLRIALP